MGRRLYRRANSAHGDSACCQSIDPHAGARRRYTYAYALGDANAASIALSYGADTDRPIPDAIGWFYAHAPDGSAYTWEAWGDPLPTDLPAQGLYRQEHGYRDVWMRIYLDMPPHDKLQHIADSLRGADYVVLSTPRIYLSVARLPWRYPVEIRYYELLFTERLGYELAAKFTAQPGLGAWTLDDLSADQSFYDYDHPPVLIYRKVRDLSDGEWLALFAEQLQAEPQPTREGDAPPVRLPVP